MATFSHIVLHQFEAGGRQLVPGDRVDATNWRNVEKLVSVKYLRPATPADLARPLQKRRVASTPLESPVTRKLKKLVIKRK